MGYAIEAGEALEAAVRRIAGEQLGKALVELDDETLDLHETAHQVRKRCKKVRGLVRLVRPGLGEDRYADVNGRLRDAARLLSGLRDAAARVETCASLRRALAAEGGTALAALEEARAGFLSARERLASNQSDVRERLLEFRGRIAAVQREAGAWTLDGSETEALRGGLERTHRRARRTLRAASAEPSVERFHEWRKRVKYARYQARVLVPLWPAPLEARRAELQRLSDLLGDDHDLAVLIASLEGAREPAIAPGHRYALLELAARRRGALERAARPLGRLLFAEPARAFGGRIAAYYEVWRSGERLPELRSA